MCLADSKIDDQGRPMGRPFSSDGPGPGSPERAWSPFVVRTKPNGGRYADRHEPVLPEAEVVALDQVARPPRMAECRPPSGLHVPDGFLHPHPARPGGPPSQRTPGIAARDQRQAVPEGAGGFHHVGLPRVEGLRHRAEGLRPRTGHLRGVGARGPELPVG